MNIATGVFAHIIYLVILFSVVDCCPNHWNEPQQFVYIIGSIIAMVSLFIRILSALYDGEDNNG